MICDQPATVKQFDSVELPSHSLCLMASQRFFLALFSILIWATHSAADEIPSSLLEQDYAECFKGCRETAEQVVCDILCTCAMNHFRSQLDFSTYNVLRAQMARTEVTPANQLFLDETGKVCEGELKRTLGILDQQ